MKKKLTRFIKMLDSEALKAGIEVRRYTAKPVSSKEFYSELPFEVELDGPYYSVLNFFDRVGKLERIVNISDLLVATTKKPSEAKAKHTYQYAASESIVATCIATTFFSHDTPAPSNYAGQEVRESYEADCRNSGTGTRNDRWICLSDRIQTSSTTRRPR